MTPLAVDGVRIIYDMNKQKAPSRTDNPETKTIKGIRYRTKTKINMCCNILIFYSFMNEMYIEMREGCVKDF